MQLIDIGVNLTNARLYHDRASHRALAEKAGVSHQIVTGTCIESSRKALTICAEDSKYYSATAGCHPHDAKDFQREHLVELKSLVSQPEVVAIGECGLDFNRNYSPQEVQLSVFRQQIELAIETQMPLFMHQRDAHEAFMDVLRPYTQNLAGGVVHCFTGTQKEMYDYIELGFYVGITGWLCDERRGDDLRAAVKEAPLEKLLLETDAPYLLPRTIKPKPKSRTNISAHLPWVLNELALIRQEAPTKIAEITTQNCHRLFKLTR